MRMYIAVLDEVPDYIVPTLVAHSVLGAHLKFTSVYSDSDDIEQFGLYEYPTYMDWLKNSYRKCVVKVNQKEFDKIADLHGTYLGHENKTLDGRKSCAIPVPRKNEDLPNVLKFAKLWKPNVA